MKKKKILLLTTVGGFIPQFETESVKLLKAYDFEIFYASDFTNCVYAQREEFLETLGVKRIQIPINKSPLALMDHRKVFLELVEVVKKYRIDCVHCHTPVGGFLGRMLGRHFGKNFKVIYTAHGFHFYQGAPAKNWLFYPVEKILARDTDALVTINNEDFERAKYWKLRDGGKVYRIPGVGIRAERLCLEEKERARLREATRKKLGISEKLPVLVSVGELNKNKNHAVILEALSDRRMKDVIYLIAGDGEERDRLRIQAKRMELDDRAYFLGYQEEIAPILSAADVFVFPSRREGLGMAALEAMAMGLPVVASDNRGSREYVISQINGYRCPWNVPEAFADAIAELLEHPGKREEMGREAEKTAGCFSLEQTARAMRQVYEKTLNVGGETGGGRDE